MIIVITDRKISARRDFLEQIELIAEAKPDMIILREKDVSEQEYKYLAIECARLCSYHNVKFCVNSFIKTAKTINNGRIQLSFGSFISHLNELGAYEEIWVSVHTPDEAADADALGATHLIYGNIFETSCKPGTEGKGLDELERVCRRVHVPVYAVGGITPMNTEMVLRTGCKGVCLRSFFMKCEDPLPEMRSLKRILSSQGK